jgi:DNA-binding IclR family transcriptional regulator
MGAEKNILELLNKKPEGSSINEISKLTGQTRATTAK